MEGSKAEKRIKLDDSEEKLVEPSLVRINKHGCAPHNIHIDKNEFKIGRARDNDEIILDAMISRKHCILRYEENEEWTIKDLSSSVTFVNDIPLTFGMSQKIYDGDIIQFSASEKFKYIFILDFKDEYKVKKPKIDENILDNVFIEQKTFAQDQECQKNILKNKLQIKQKQQEKLKQQLKQLLRQQNVTKEDTKDLKHQIILLENKIKHGNVQEQYLQNMYTDLLEKLENERIEFEKKLNEEKQKWQEALNVSKLEKEMLELKMKEQMEKWREEQQTKWKNVMENRVKEEKNIQAQLLNEKIILEEKLKKTEKALKEQAKIETINNVAGTSDNSNDSCIFLETKNPSEFQIIDTIDLTIPTQVVSKIDEKESVLNKINDIMDEQLTCTICSELFVKATTLNCMHTFCQHCINVWNKKRKECPICRASVSSMNRSIVLDNFIESMLKNLPIQFKERRKEILEERQAMEYKKKIR
ncbi:E3 ubiquitin-protein ligase RNF8-like isoform X1 [Apis dorsata]|uniref:E3 ubiquitin-protein ligase RNF8-like isoform X1 n=1 Tax=Apis dorsata TaxID=7462 RepID=UPI0003DF6E49|nr:E3 ubiquitin-protein ligase RNF8-like isoform X1 [Apis dorsata]